MKKLFLLLTAIAIIGSSCKKKPRLHKIEFKFKVLQQSKYGKFTPIYLSILPKYENVNPKVESELVEEWSYQYLGLKDGDKIYFAVDIPLSSYYEKWIYIDGKEVAYRRIKVSDYEYYKNEILEERGSQDIDGWGYEYKE